MKKSVKFLNALKVIQEANVAEINLMIEAIRARQSAVQLEEGAKFSVGDKVSFEEKYSTVSGIIQKINRKTIVVKTSQGQQWRVSPSLLSLV